MLKHLAIFAVLSTLTTFGISAIQSASANSPESPVTTQSAGKAESQQANSKQGNTESTIPTSVDVQAKQETDAEKENIDIQRKLEWFTGGLVIVGLMQAFTMIWQAGLLLGTLRVIQTQAGHMERQTKILEDSVAAVQKSADATLAQVEAAKIKERAQLRIEFAEPEWTFNEEVGGYPVHFQVISDGASRAYVLQNSILAYMARTARKEKTVSADMGIPRNFTPEMSPFEGYTLIRKDGMLPTVDTEPGKADIVNKHNFTVFVDGQIWYRDIFGDEWILEIDRCWVPNSRWGGEDTTGGMWAPFGSGRRDTHRKVDTKNHSPKLQTGTPP
jgi:hypothetical protein